MPFSLIQISFRDFIHFTFTHINIKSQSKESFFLCVSLLNISIYFLFYFSSHRALSSSNPLISIHLLFTFNPFSFMGRFTYLVDSVEGIENFKTQYRIPPRVSIRYCKQGDWHAQRHKGEVVIPMIAFIEGEMRIPMGTVTKDYLRVHSLGSVDALNEKMGLNLTHHDVNWVYNLHQLKGQGYYIET